MPPIFSPEELSVKVERAALQAGTVQFVTDRRLNRVREMWCAAIFGAAYARKFTSCSIDIEELDEQRDYDFHLILPNGRLPFQVSEVLDSDRLRDHEYRKDAFEKIIHDLDARQALCDEDAAHRIREQLQAKIDKRYSNPHELHILLYVNLKCFGLSWQSIKAATEELSPNFSSVWLMTDQLMSCIHGGNIWPSIDGWWSIEDVG